MSLYYKFKGWQLSKKTPDELKYYFDFKIVKYAIKEKCYNLQISAMQDILLSDSASYEHKTMVDNQLSNLRRMEINDKNIVDILLINCNIIYRINYGELNDLEDTKSTEDRDMGYDEFVADRYNSMEDYGTSHYQADEL